MVVLRGCANTGHDYVQRPATIPRHQINHKRIALTDDLEQRALWKKQIHDSTEPYIFAEYKTPLTAKPDKCIIVICSDQHKHILCISFCLTLYNFSNRWTRLAQSRCLSYKTIFGRNQKTC